MAAGVLDGGGIGVLVVDEVVMEDVNVFSQVCLSLVMSNLDGDHIVPHEQGRVVERHHLHGVLNASDVECIL